MAEEKRPAQKRTHPSSAPDSGEGPPESRARPNYERATLMHFMESSGNRANVSKFVDIQTFLNFYSINTRALELLKYDIALAQRKNNPERRHEIAQVILRGYNPIVHIFRRIGTLHITDGVVHPDWITSPVRLVDGVDTLRAERVTYALSVPTSAIQRIMGHVVDTMAERKDTPFREMQLRSSNEWPLETKRQHLVTSSVWDVRMFDPIDSKLDYIRERNVKRIGVLYTFDEHRVMRTPGEWIERVREFSQVVREQGIEIESLSIRDNPRGRDDMIQRRTTALLNAFGHACKAIVLPIEGIGPDAIAAARRLSKVEELSPYSLRNSYSPAPPELCQFVLCCANSLRSISTMLSPTDDFVRAVATCRHLQKWGVSVCSNLLPEHYDLVSMSCPFIRKMYIPHDVVTRFPAILTDPARMRHLEDLTIYGITEDGLDYANRVLPAHPTIRDLYLKGSQDLSVRALREFIGDQRGRHLTRFYCSSMDFRGMTANLFTDNCPNLKQIGRIARGPDTNHLVVALQDFYQRRFLLC